MKPDKNYTKISVKWRIFISISTFSLILILLLWLFQVVFLNDFYKSVKTRQIQTTAHEVATNIASNHLSDFIDDKSENSDYCIQVIAMSTATIYYENKQNRSVCGYLISGWEDIWELYWEAKNNGGRVIRDQKDNIFNGKFNDFSRQYDLYGDKEDGEIPKFEINVMKEVESITYGEIVESHETDYLVLVNSRITIVNELAETIRTQLIIICIIVLVASLLIAFVISSLIAKPIVKINESAKELAKGKFDVHFEGKGYLEIEELNDTLNYASKELSKVEKLRNELIANMSHDLRTPLTMIAGYGEVMRDLPGENTPENVQIIIDECHRLTDLVNDILDLSKLQSGTQTLSMQSFNITQCIQNIVTRISKMLEKDGYLISFSFDEEAIVYADPIKMNQVIYNLLVNAVHYSGVDKQIEIRQRKNKDCVRIEVEDHGEGISSKDLPYVWDRYYKIDKVHKRSAIGSGLGLSIVKGILELHHSIYGVTSKVNEGTIFYFEVYQEKNK